ncbi:methylated-DNA--[protein]-cysteine S-methyltransferase [Anaerosolibacter sp.]|uniref:methylated-DNA--[protein]-cysteine S-methyltransferase n=1 Tax=Anaerosolibacter sp. TaxID=1872527 RepID=UPI0039F08A37
MYKKILIDKSEIDSLRSKDDNMKLLIDSIGEINREYIPDPFVALVNSIVFQQLAYKAAISIWNKFEQFIGNITADHILNASFESLRECGLSKTKISYIKNIAEAVKRNEINFSNFERMSDEEIIEKLVRVKGIGTWTAEMFLIFSLNRKDIMSYKDLGIRKGLKWLYNMKEEPTVEQFEKFKNRFSPNNTLASFYLWEITIRNYFKYENIEQVVFKNNVTYFDSPIGLLEIQSIEGEITGLSFLEERRYDEKVEPILEEAKKQLEEYFYGVRKIFDLPIKMSGTDFQNIVWQELTKIPYGKTLSYGAIATAIGNEKAHRAVGNANNKNRIAIVIPCHRVVGSSGKLVGYAGGLNRKKWLLEHEKAIQ